MFRRLSILASLFVVLLMVFFARRINLMIPAPDMEKQDIYYSFVEGQRLAQGENPYERILSGNMRQNKKYSTYFPVFYELSFLSQKMGLRTFPEWITFWKYVFMAFEFGVALMLYLVFAFKKIEWLGVFAAAFWLFNRWTLIVVKMQNLDFIPIFFLLLSLVMFSKNKWWGLFFFSLSLGFKQIAVFLAPLYLIWIWQDEVKNRFRNILQANLIITSVPFISALPFLVWNAQGFIMSIMFSATRVASDHLGYLTVDVIAGWEGLSARIGMLALIAFVYLFAIRGHGTRFFSSFVVLSIFLDFNSVFYIQYPAWIIPLLPLVFLELRDSYWHQFITTDYRPAN